MAKTFHIEGFGHVGMANVLGREIQQLVGEEFRYVAPDDIVEGGHFIICVDVKYTGKNKKRVEDWRRIRPVTDNETLQEVDDDE